MRAATSFPATPSCWPQLTGTPEVSMMLTTPKLRVIHVTTHIGLHRRHRARSSRAWWSAPSRAATTALAKSRHRRARGSASAPSIRTPARMACSATARRSRRSSRPSRPARRGAGTWRGRCRPTRCSSAPGAATSTWWWPCTTTRGTGPVKVLGLEAGVNITVGLPVVRTSVDHGTAFDIAGTGKADERSMLEAIRQAVVLATRRAGRPAKA